MYKNITKNLIYFAVFMFIFPVSTVSAKDNTNIQIEAQAIVIKPQIEAKTNIKEIRNVIDESLAQKQVEIKSRPASNIPGNSRDWSKSKYTESEIKEKICQVFTSNCREALIIAKNESGFRPWAISKTNDYGVFQLNCRWQKKRVGGDCNKFLDPDTNIRIAKQIYTEQGWNPWTTKIYLQ